MPRVKVCGITDAAFAAVAAQHGVDYIGVIFAVASPRHVSVARAQRIASAARAARPSSPPRVVGVFVGGTDAEIAKVAETVPLDIIQLHGGQSETVATALKDAGYEIWVLDNPRNDDAYASHADAVIVDGYDGIHFGGTGQRSDWTRVEALKRAGHRVVLAGGLSAENAAAASKTGADVLDFNSSLEMSPGVKSPERLEAVLHALR